MSAIGRVTRHISSRLYSLWNAVSSPPRGLNKSNRSAGGEKPTSEPSLPSVTLAILGGACLGGWVFGRGLFGMLGFWMAVFINVYEFCCFSIDLQLF